MHLKNWNYERMKKMKKEYVRVRLNEIERKVLIENSKKAKMTMSDYIRYCCIVIPLEKIMEAKL